MLPIVFSVQGEPKAQPRPKAMRRGNFISIYTPATAKIWKGLVASAAKPFLLSEPLDQPLRLDAIFRMPRPKSHYLKSGLRPTAPKFHTAKPDTDNLIKAVMDCLTDVGLWRDDSIICVQSCVKVYANSPEEVGVTINIDKA